MNTEKFDRQTIFGYLLGTLDDSKEVRFDELSITDDEFADELAAAENELIDAHVRGELDPESAKHFETHYLASPRRREKADFARTLHVFVEDDQAKAQTISASVGFFSSVKNLFTANRFQLGFAMAAMLILILGGFWFAGRRTASSETAVLNTPEITASPQSDGQLNNNETAISPEKNIGATETGNAPANKRIPDADNKVTPANQTIPVPQIRVATLILSPPLRGSNQVTNFPISKEITDVAVMLQLEANEFPAYRVSLNDGAGKNIIQSGTLRTHGNSLNMRFPAKLLKSGIYSLIVTGIKDGETEIISNYSFRSVIK